MALDVVLLGFHHERVHLHGLHNNLFLRFPLIFSRHFRLIHLAFEERVVFAKLVFGLDFYGRLIRLQRSQLLDLVQLLTLGGGIVAICFHVTAHVVAVFDATVVDIQVHH